MKKTLYALLTAASLVAIAPGWAVAAPPANPTAAAAALSPADRADLFRLGASPASLLQQSAGDAVLIVGDGGHRRWHDGYGYYYGYGFGSLILTAVIVSVIIISQAPYR
jgi:hypothetical protein